MMVRLFSRDAVAKSPCTCGSLPGIYIFPDSEYTLHYSVIIGNVYGVCCPVNISTEHFEFSRLRKTESVTL